MPKVKVLVVEDDSFTRSTLAATLEYEGFEVPGPAESAVAAISSFNRFDHDALLVDLDLGSGPNGAELAWLLRKTKPNLGIVFLTSFEDPRLHRRALEELPSGSRYLIKQDLADRSQISQALQFSVSWAIGQGDRKGGNPDAPKKLKLTNVQIETLRMVSEGLSNQEIALERFVTENAVEQTIRRIIQQLELESTGRHLRVEMTKAFHRLTSGSNK
jgi:DNA-binding NarL/FixJ family response regulator